MDKTEVRAVIKNLKKKSTTPTEINGVKVHIKAEDSLSDITVKWAVKFKRSRDSKDKRWQGR